MVSGVFLFLFKSQFITLGFWMTQSLGKVLGSQTINAVAERNVDNPAVTAFLRNEMYCDWCHALNIGSNELWRPTEVVQLVQVPGSEHNPQTYIK